MSFYQTIRVLALSLFVTSISVSAFAELECPAVISKDTAYLQSLKVTEIKDGKPQASYKEMSIPTGRVTAVRLFGTWCPHCKTDMLHIDKNMKGLVDGDKLDVMIVVFKSRLETEETLKSFLDGGAKQMGISKDRFEWRYANVDGPGMRALKTKSGSALFPDFGGIPYSLIFDSQGQLRFIGNFTESDASKKQQYDMIKALAEGKC